MHKSLPKKTFNKERTDVINAFFVDDDESDFLFIERCLARSKYSFDLTWCKDTDDAIDALKRDEFDIYFFDYCIDIRTGIELIDEIKDYLICKKTNIIKPLIMLTGMEDQNVVVEALHLGVDDFIPKNSISTICLDRSISNALEKFDLRTEISKNNKELELSNKNLIKKNEEIKKFYQTVSHELKTPLTSIQEFISIIKDEIPGKLNNKQKEYLDISFWGCKQMTLYINDLLEVTRLDSNKVTIKPTPQIIEPLLIDVTRFMSEKAKRKNIEITVNIENNLPMLNIDPARIKQTLINLIANAIKFTPENGAISVTAQLLGTKKGINISVIDNGRGIPKKECKHIFDRLYQIEDSNKSSQNGLGLGLYICKQLIGMHDGQLSVESEVDNGSTFTISLPLDTSSPFSFSKELLLERH